MGMFIKRSWELMEFLLINDTFHLIQINDSTFHISPSNQYPGTPIRIKSAQDHLLVLDYIADPFDNSYGLDSLIR